MIAMLLAAVGGYLLGSVPFGFLLSRMAGLGDIRRVGSGNIGATNVLRTGRRDVAAATLLLDGGKGAAAVLIAGLFPGAVLPLIAGVAAVLGHCTTVWMGGRGGKGVATGLGTLLGWGWPVGLACCLVWLVGAFAAKRSSVAALLAFFTAPLLMLSFRAPAMAVGTLLISLIVVFRHRDNIHRLLAGTEPLIKLSR